MQSVQEKYKNLQEYLKSLGSVAVAFSSGVDSTFLLAAAKKTLGADHVIAVTASSCSFPKRELEEAKQFCKEQGIRHIVCKSEELDIEGFDAFLLTLRVQFCKLLLVKLLDGKLNGQERVQKAPILLSAVLRDDYRTLCLNQPALDQFCHIFSHGVRAHIDSISNRPIARMALIRCPILDVHQIAVDRQRAW